MYNNESSDLDDSDNESDEGEPDIEDVHLIEAPLSRMVTEMSAPNGGRILNAISLPMPVSSFKITGLP